MQAPIFMPKTMCFSTTRSVAVGCAVRTAARHLLAMCAVMALFHMAWLTFPGAGGHHQHGSSSTPTASASHEHAGHGSSMLGVIGAELLCLAGATALLRTGARRTPPEPTDRGAKP